MSLAVAGAEGLALNAHPGTPNRPRILDGSQYCLDSISASTHWHAGCMHPSATCSKRFGEACERVRRTPRATIARLLARRPITRAGSPTNRTVGPSRVFFAARPIRWKLTYSGQLEPPEPSRTLEHRP